jgi:acyl-CoA thioester hydrolase
VSGIYQFAIQVSAADLDVNRHVNNVTYVQWMQDAAVRHSNSTGCTRMTSAEGAIWVARSHHIEYLRPAFAGDVVTASTWVCNFRKVRSLRQYQFFNARDQIVLARGETDWVFVDAKTGRPKAIPDEIRNAFQIVAAEEMPPAHFGRSLS